MECEIPNGYKALVEDNPEFYMFNDETFVTKDSIYIANGEKVNYKLIITKINIFLISYLFFQSVLYRFLSLICFL